MPPPEQGPTRRSTAGSIYAIGAADSPYVKIGSTKTSVEQRLRSLQTGQPATLHIVAKQTVETDLHRIERQIHKFLAAERHHGEWFALMLDAAALQQLIMRAIDFLAEEDRYASGEIAHHIKRRRGNSSPEEHVLSQALLAYRQQMGLTQEELATRLGCKRVSICHYETGTVTPPLSRLQALAKIFAVSLDTLVNGKAVVPALAFHPLPPSQPSIIKQPKPSTPTAQLAWEW